MTTKHRRNSRRYDTSNRCNSSRPFVPERVCSLRASDSLFVVLANKNLLTTVYYGASTCDAHVRYSFSFSSFARRWNAFSRDRNKPEIDETGKKQQPYDFLSRTFLSMTTVFRRSRRWTTSNESLYSRRRATPVTFRVWIEILILIRKNFENIRTNRTRESDRAIFSFNCIYAHDARTHVDVVRYSIVRRLCFFVKLASSDQFPRYFCHGIITSVDEMSDGSIIYRISRNVNGSCQFTIVLVLPFVPPVSDLFTSKSRYEDRPTWKRA